MSRKYIRRFIRYHPGLFQDQKLILVMACNPYSIYLSDISRIFVRYRKAKSSDYLMLQLKQIINDLKIDYREMLTLSRIDNFLNS